MANEIVFDVYKNTLKCAGGLAPVSGEFAYSEIVCRFDANDEDWKNINKVTFGFFVTAKKTVGAVATKSGNEVSAPLPSSLIKGYSEVYVGIVGTFDGKTIATNVVKIDVKRGIVTDNMEGVAETESLYEEIMGAINEVASKVDAQSLFATPETYGAAGDGVTDDTEAINQCLAENSVVVFNKSYAIDTIHYGGVNVLNSYGIDIPSNRALIFVNGAKLVCIPNESCIYNAIRLVNVENVVIDGLELQADRSNEAFLKKRKADGECALSTDQGVGILIAGSKNVTIKNTTVCDASAGISIWSTGDAATEGSADFVISEKITLENCISRNNRRDGLTIGSSKDVSIVNCCFEDNGLSATYTNVWGITNEAKYTNEGLTVNGDYVTVAGVMQKTGVNIEPDYEHNPAHNITFENCRFSGNGQYGMMDSRHANWSTPHHSNIRLINCESDGIVQLSNGDFIVDGGKYKHLRAGHMPKSGIVNGAVINKIYSSVLKRGVVTFTGCHVIGLYDISGETATLQANAEDNTKEAWIELNDCVIENCVANEGLNRGHIVLNGCFVRQSSGRFSESGHIHAENTEFHFEDRESTEISAIKFTSAEFNDCDFYYPEDRRVELFSVYSSAFNESKTWHGNRFHNALNTDEVKPIRTSTFNPRGNSLIKNWFNFPSTKLIETAPGEHIGNIFTDKKGVTAYEIAVEHGYSGTEEAWLASLKGADGADGTNGKDGTNGADGFSPVATVTQTASGATVSITDKNGTTTANISNGADGQDYVLTNQDKSDIADIVLSELPTTQGVLYGNTSN